MGITGPHQLNSCQNFNLLKQINSKQTDYTPILAFRHTTIFTIPQNLTSSTKLRFGSHELLFPNITRKDQLGPPPESELEFLFSSQLEYRFRRFPLASSWNVPWDPKMQIHRLCHTSIACSICGFGSLSTWHRKFD